jgi:hypothetical protein
VTVNTTLRAVIVPAVTPGVPRERRRVAGLAVVAALVLAAAPGCGSGGDGEGRPTLTALPSRTASATLPSVTLSLPTATRTDIGEQTSGQPTTPEATTPEATTPEATTPEATTPEATTPEATTAEPTLTGGEEAAGPTSSPAVSPSSVPAATATADEVAETQADTTTSDWVVLAVILALAVAATALVVALRQRSARHRWTASLEASVAESRGLARDIVPSLLEASRESRRGGWQVARPQVVAAEERLADLAQSAPDVETSATARGLVEAVGDLRRRLDDEVGATDANAAAALEAARDASRRLDDRLSLLASAPDAERT